MLRMGFSGTIIKEYRIGHHLRLPTIMKPLSKLWITYQPPKYKPCRGHYWPFSTFGGFLKKGDTPKIIQYEWLLVVNRPFCGLPSYHLVTPGSSAPGIRSTPPLTPLFAPLRLHSRPQIPSCLESSATKLVAPTGEGTPGGWSINRINAWLVVKGF